MMIYKEINVNFGIACAKFLYNGYLCVQQVFSNAPWNVYKEFIWDPTEPIATRPLCFRQNSKASTFFVHDGNKNVTDVITVGPANIPVAHYDYAPFGALTTASGSRAIDNPFHFSSEYHDDTLGLVYYNYRHYNPIDGRWCGRDRVEEDSRNIYSFLCNNILTTYDLLGENRYFIYISTFKPQDFPSAVGFPITHAEIAVDAWECRDGNWNKTGEVRFGFYPSSFNIFSTAGDVRRSTQHIGTLAYKTIESSPCSDVCLLKELKRLSKAPPHYFIVGNNCYDFAIQMAFGGLGI